MAWSYAPRGTGVVSAADQAYVDRNNASTIRAGQGSARMRWIRNGILGVVGGGAGAGVLGAIGAGGTAAGAGVGGSGAAAGTAGGGFGAMGWLKAGELAAGTFGNIYGANKASTANRDALAAEKLAGDQAYQIALADRAESQRQFDLQQAAMKADLDARNKFESDRWAASEEERLYDRRLRDDRETRRAPYRAASAEALARLPSLLASGRSSPGMGTFGSFRR